AIAVWFLSRCVRGAMPPARGEHDAPRARPRPGRNHRYLWLCSISPSRFHDSPAPSVRYVERHALRETTKSSFCVAFIKWPKRVSNVSSDRDRIDRLYTCARRHTKLAFTDLLIPICGNLRSHSAIHLGDIRHRPKKHAFSDARWLVC